MADDLVTLRLPPGAADGAISLGTEEFKPYRADHTDPTSPWHVDMPRAASADFLRQGGFTMVAAAPAPALPHGFVVMEHPDAGPPPSVATPMGGRHVMVPQEFVATLRDSHGYVIVDPNAPDPEEPKTDAKDARIAELEALLAETHATGAHQKHGVAALSPEARAEIKEAKAEEKAEAKADAAELAADKKKKD